MTQFENACIAAAKAFLATYNKAENKTFDFPVAKSAVSIGEDGIPICNIHGKHLIVSKTPRDITKDYYYCPTKDEETGKWCRSKAGKSA